MSTNSECEFLKCNDQWYYILEDYNAPKNAWDWREYATAYGPFKTEEIAEQHLSRHHANPGGWSTFDQNVDLEKDPTLKELIEKARK